MSSRSPNANRSGTASASEAGAASALLQFDEHPVSAGRVDERHARAFGPGSGLLVDEPNPTVLQLRQRAVDVLDAQRDVVQARAALLVYLAIADSGDVASSSSSAAPPTGMKCARTRWRLDVLHAFDLEPERLAIEPQGRRQVGHGDADVIENRLHLISPGN